MRVRSLHRVIGIILLLPLFSWAITGFVFFVKPGYEGAYEVLAPKTYLINTQLPISPAPGWQEVKYLRSILGDHLLVRTRSGWIHLDPATNQPREPPSESDLRRLLEDAFTTNPSRYGSITAVNDNTVTTSTGVEVTLDWNRMTLQQKGRDTDRIDLLYRIHYLQWTGIKSVDRVVGLVGIALVLTLTTLGAWLAFRGGRANRHQVNTTSR
jgi:uncharacterized iron-regulated membrane protein